MGQVSNEIRRTKPKKYHLLPCRSLMTCWESQLVSLASSPPTLDVSPDPWVLLLWTANRFIQTHGEAAWVSLWRSWQSSPLKEEELLHYSDKGEKEAKALVSLHKALFIISKCLHKLKGDTTYGVKTPPKFPCPRSAGRGLTSHGEQGPCSLCMALCAGWGCPIGSYWGRLMALGILLLLKEKAAMTVASKKLWAAGCPELRWWGRAGAFGFTVKWNGDRETGVTFAIS